MGMIERLHLTSSWPKGGRKRIREMQMVNSMRNSRQLLEYGPSPRRLGELQLTSQAKKMDG